MTSPKKKQQTKVAKTGDRHQSSIAKINEAMINHARVIAHEIGATAVLVYVDVIKSPENMEILVREDRCILAAQSQEIINGLKDMGDGDDRIIPVPQVNLTRIGQIKVAAMLALAGGLIAGGDRLVCLSGSVQYGVLDNLMVLDVDREFEVFCSKDLDLRGQLVRPHVFDRLLTLVLELAEEGKEGKPVGTIFVLGDHRKVMELSSPMIFNPFVNVPEKQRNIMDPKLKEMIREFATIDGAFVIRDDGVILAAGRHLKASSADTELPQGLGARHRAAAGITGLTKALAVVISESTGDVRIFSQGKIFAEIEKNTGGRNR